MNPQGKTLLKILISLGLLSFFFLHSGIDQTLEQLSSANLWYVPLGVAIYLGSQWISAYRWQFLSRPLGFDLALREFYDYYLMGMFLSLFLPGAIGGDVGRMIYLAKSRNRKKRDALLTLLAERGVGLVALLWLVACACLTTITNPFPFWIRMGMILLALTSLLGFLLLRIVPLRPLAEKFPFLGLLVQAEIYWRNVPLLAKSIGLSLLVHGCMISIHLLIAQALGMEVPWLYMMAVYGVVGLASVLPISFNGLGVREGAYLFLLQKIGVPAPLGLAFGLYWFLISALTSLMGGIIFLKGHYKTPLQVEDEARVAHPG